MPLSQYLQEEPAGRRVTGRGPASSVAAIENYLKQGGDLLALGLPAWDKPLFEVIEGEGDNAKVHPVFSIPGILDKVMEIGKRGMEIKRFKGLGEMNAKQLFETTMDPNKRTLLQIKLDETNAHEAERIFTILMGDVVEPRKHFSEENALNVRNLDV